MASHNLESALANEVRAIEAEMGGTLCFHAREIASGREWHYRSEQKCRTASIIKLPILVHVALSAAEGVLQWSEPLTVTDSEKVDGSGVLTHLSGGLQLSLRDCCVLMTIVSDNTATNMVIERLGVDAINTRMRSLGLALTTLYRKAYSPDTDASREFGLGMSTPGEMLRLVTGLAERTIGPGSACDEMETILGQQYYRDGIPRLLDPAWSYSGKTGAVDGVRNDVGIVIGPDGRRIAMAIFCQDVSDLRWTADNTGLIAQARVARLLCSL